MSVLKVPRSRAEELLADFGERGKTLIDEAQKSVSSEVEYKNWQMARTRWKKLTATALTHIYGDEAKEVTEFEQTGRRFIYAVGTPWQHDLEYDISGVVSAINVLISLGEQLAFAEEPPGGTGSPPASALVAPPDSATSAADPSVIFLVHGRNEGTREMVARLLEKVGNHDVVILQEKANRGRTLIEKFEEHAAQTRYAVVLLTGDDVGDTKPGTNLSPRARQNVIFEMGFFCGSINRSRVAVLYEHDVERPSDIDGLAYIELDPAGAWKLSLVRELIDAGLDCDVNAI